MIRFISTLMALLVFATSPAFSATQSIMKLTEGLPAADSSLDLSDAPTPAPGPDCTQLISRLIELNSNLSSLKASVVATSQDVGSVMNSWYGTLSSHYGQKVYISYGAFDAMRQSAQTSYENASFFSLQFSKLENELRYVTQDVASCLMK